ncbi:MAG: hypothetical protein ABJA02_00410 [Acidobacteriota bacterium]
MVTATPKADDPTHSLPHILGGSMNLAHIFQPKLNRSVVRVMQHFTDEFFVRIKVPQFIESVRRTTLNLGISTDSLSDVIMRPETENVEGIQWSQKKGANEAYQ